VENISLKEENIEIIDGSKMANWDLLSKDVSIVFAYNMHYGGCVLSPLSPLPNMVISINYCAGQDNEYKLISNGLYSSDEIKVQIEDMDLLSIRLGQVIIKKNLYFHRVLEFIACEYYALNNVKEDCDEKGVISLVRQELGIAEQLSPIVRTSGLFFIRHFSPCRAKINKINVKTPLYVRNKERWVRDTFGYIPVSFKEMKRRLNNGSQKFSDDQVGSIIRTWMILKDMDSQLYVLKNDNLSLTLSKESRKERIRAAAELHNIVNRGCQTTDSPRSPSPEISEIVHDSDSDSDCE